jgi:hypothetical protein
MSNNQQRNQKRTKLFSIPNPNDWRRPLYDAIRLYLREERGLDAEVVKMDIKSSAFGLIISWQFAILILHLFLYYWRSFFTTSTLVEFSVNDIEIGRYAAAQALRDPSSGIKKFRFHRKIFWALLKGLGYYSYAKKVAKDIDYAYLHDTPYLLGIIVDVFLAQGIGVFIKGYPHNILLCEGRELSQLKVLISRDDREDFSEEAIRDYMSARLDDPLNTISYFQSVEDTSKTFELAPNQKIAVVYAHSFTDAQLSLGYDGFLNVYEWLEFTIDYLLSNGFQVVVKAHPNFWATGFESQVVYWDQKIWEQVVKKYEARSNLIIIDWPLNNYTLLRRLPKNNSVLVSHHGNAIIEGAYLGFKTLSSTKAVWGEYYKFGEFWKDKESYVQKLAKDPSTYQYDLKECMHYIHDKYLNPFGYHGPFNARYIISDALGMSFKELEKLPSYMKKENIPNYEAVVAKVKYGIICIDEK